MQRNQEAPKAYPGEYSTDLVAARALSFLDEAIPAGKPFFIGVAPIGPHSQTINSVFDAPVPAERHKDLYPGLKVPRTANFNPDVVCQSIIRPPAPLIPSLVLPFFLFYPPPNHRPARSPDDPLLTGP